MLAHACNAKGIWGSGVAKSFKFKFPNVFDVYHNIYQLGLMRVGDCCVIPDDKNHYWGIACLITSKNYGKYVDAPEKILDATCNAVTSLLKQVPFTIEIHMPRINSGLFNVPWESTENIINQLASDHKIVVWTPEQ